MSTARETEVRTRRRIATLAGLFTLLIASGTACIFEKNSYQGGGRQDQGAEGATAQPSSSVSAAPTIPTTTPTTDSAPNPLLDAATGG
jgi:hypothetical protein